MLASINIMLAFSCSLAHTHHYLFLSIADSIPLTAIYYRRNHQSDEEFEEMLRQNYSNNIEGSKAKRQEMSIFLQGIKNPNSNADTERKMAEVLKGGRGEAKRHYAVDENLYGTEEGVRLRKEAEDLVKRQTRKKDARRRMRPDDGKTKDWKEELEQASKSGVAASDKRSNKKPNASKTKKSQSTRTPEFSESRKVVAGVDTKQVVLVTVVGALAAGIGFLLGGKKSQ